MLPHQGAKRHKNPPATNGGIFIAYLIVPEARASHGLGGHDRLGPVSGRVASLALRQRAIFWVACAALIGVSTLQGLAARPASGFTIDDGLTNGTPRDHSDDLLDAARWSNVPGTLADHSVRGLGGGLEYSIAPDFCSRIIPNFIDHPDCEEIEDSVHETLAIWSEGNPMLRFVDVSGGVLPELPPPGSSQPWLGFGAEIDLFVLSPEEYPRLYGVGAWTQFWYTFEDAAGPRGLPVPGNTITSSDMVFSTRACFYLDPSLGGFGCNHFPSLLLEEAGHSLGLDHANEFSYRNFDTDDDPSNSITIDCRSSGSGLVLSPRFDERAVMNSTYGMPTTVNTTLSPDDLGGRDFLYPVCPAP